MAGLGLVIGAVVAWILFLSTPTETVVVKVGIPHLTAPATWGKRFLVLALRHG